MKCKEEISLTLEDIRKMDRDILTPAIVAPVIECSATWIRLTARECPKELGFPVIVRGSRVKIPRLAFIRFMEGRAEQ